MVKPNFLIIGAPKSGTTSLFNYLSQHPDIGFSKHKEPKYFSFKDISLDFIGNKTVVNQIKKSTVQNSDEYQNLFKNINNKYIGEASPNYLHFPAAAKNIYDFNANMKLIAILRNPIDKTFSDWKHNYAMGYEPVSNFRRALSLIEKRKQENFAPYFDYINKGMYASHLERYFKFFKREQIKIVFFDDFKMDPNKTCNEIINFLGIDKPFSFETDKIYMKASTISKSYQIKRISNFLGRNFSVKIKNAIDSYNEINLQLTAEDKTFLKEVFKDDITKLEKIVDMDLNLWFK